MVTIDEIVASIHQRLKKEDDLREQVLPIARSLIRESSILIKNSHRREWQEAQKRYEGLLASVNELKGKLRNANALRYSGFVQDAFKEVTEACIVYSILKGKTIPTPEELSVDDAPYINGLLEAMGELRRAVLDAIRSDDLESAERYLSIMDTVYFQVMTFDQTDAITQGVRRRTDNLRVILERTRSDITIANQYRKFARILPLEESEEDLP